MDVAPKPGAFAVERLDLNNFRNYGFLNLNVAQPARPMVLTGANGAGKTNLLEALSFLAPGRGLRHAKIADAARQGETGWAIAAKICLPAGAGEIEQGARPAGQLEIGTGWAADGQLERRAILIDGEPQSGSGVLAEWIDVLWLTPQMDRLLADGAGARRRFLDRLVYGCDPAHAKRVGSFERAMRERNRLLAMTSADPAWLDAIEDQMAGHAVAIAATRLATVERLNVALAEGTGAFPQARLVAQGWIEDRLAFAPALAAEEAYRADLAQSRRRDVMVGATVDGPHRSDLAVFGAMPRSDGVGGAASQSGIRFGPEQPAATLSTGEQKALLISMILAQTRLVALQRGAYPILLLDEVVAHLDAGRREALFEIVGGLGAQVWLTGTEPALFEPLAGQAEFVAVRDGLAAPQGAKSGAAPVGAKKVSRPVGR